MQSILGRIAEEINNNKKIAMAIVTKVSGSSPGALGATMGVFEDGSIVGTVGGGYLEATVIKKALECIEKNQSGSFGFSLNNKDVENSLNMACGGETEIFIKVHNQRPKLLIVGGGHVAYEIYKLAEYMNFSTTIFEDREDFGNDVRFPNAEIMLGDINETLRNYDIDNNCYVVIVSRGHAHDEIALREVISSNAKYIGMIGSKSKVESVFNTLRGEGVSEETINRVYAPIGLAIGGREVNEIALGIMSEIVLVKNGGYSSHMKYISK